MSGWQKFTIDGTERKVRMTREFEERGSLWREYENERGKTMKVQARGPGGRRAEAQAHSARRAAERFAGYL